MFSIIFANKIKKKTPPNCCYVMPLFDIDNIFTSTLFVSGTFSSVYTAKLRKLNIDETFALKHILPTSHPTRIESELRCLKEIGYDNIFYVTEIFCNKVHKLNILYIFKV